MPDTGAPWNLPYPLPTALVRDAPEQFEDLAEAVADGLDAAGNAGIGSNVVQTVKTNVFSTTSTSFVDITGLTATITPSSNTSKILIIGQVAYAQAANTSYGHFRLNGGNASTFVGDAAGSRVQAVFGGRVRSDARNDLLSSAIFYLDSPASTSPQTYAVQARRGGNGSAIVNRSLEDTSNAGETRGASSIVVIEVAA